MLSALQLGPCRHLSPSSASVIRAPATVQQARARPPKLARESTLEPAWVGLGHLARQLASRTQKLFLLRSLARVLRLKEAMWDCRRFLREWECLVCRQCIILSLSFFFVHCKCDLWNAFSAKSPDGRSVWRHATREGELQQTGSKCHGGLSGMLFWRCGERACYLISPATRTHAPAAKQGEPPPPTAQIAPSMAGRSLTLVSAWRAGTLHESESSTPDKSRCIRCHMTYPCKTGSRVDDDRLSITSCCNQSFGYPGPT